jgi:hypothetical protein
MADLNASTEEPSAETHNTEKFASKTRVHLPRNSIFITHGGINLSVRTRRQSSRRTSSHRGGFDRHLIRYENTYRMAPDDDHKVDLVRIRRIATGVIETAIADYKYDANQAKQFSVALAERVRNHMKQLPFPRYKIVTQVSIGQKKGQDLRITSRCIWDVQWDRHITITKETSDAYVTVTLFYIYTE